MASNTCSYYISGRKVSDLTIITPDEVQAKLLDDGSIYFELDVQLIYNAYAGNRTFGSGSCFATHETGIDLSFQIGAGNTCNVTFTQGSDTYIKTQVKDELYAYFGGSNANPPPSKSVVTSGKWIVKISGSSASAVKSMCLSQDSKGAFFWFRLQNYSKAWAKMWTNYGRYLSSYSSDLCYGQNKDIYIKVYIPFAVKIESIYFKPSDTVNAGTEVEVWAKLTNLTGKPFNSVFRFSGVSRDANAKVFDVKTALHIKIGTNDYMIGKVKYTAEDELVIYLEATPKSLFVKGNVSGESQVCYWGVAGSIKCIPTLAVRKNEYIVVDPKKDTYLEGETITIRYGVDFNKPANFELILTVNDSVIARKTAINTVGDSISTKWTTPKAGIYKICGDYRILSSQTW